ncbi:lipopolysaccharide biosynthesis protein [Sphingomonas sp. BN140010]|uniref:Lipopolysaccharide biosynthesis protein n=1 Tax=Sphingomonas arvum TaxID=2992113 RepID=A0ABT3JFK3_9SPHN|nr:lipopolysaccharide biosynthesis protein [Sphingomonas sp. BN140010]MCW3797591.1 lipopolysaccharide biosynthesis protein [Sphingomonas sp. BN140010]
MRNPSPDRNSQSAPETGYRRKAVGGTIVTGVGAVSRAFLQVLAIVLLARLLTPDDFGVMGMVFPIVAFAGIFQEAGLNLAVVQRGQISDEELSTVFWINTALGVTLCLLLIAAAPFVAAFYGEPRVAALTAASGTLVLLGALAAQHSALLNRAMHFGRLALIDGLSLLAGTALAIAAAFYYRTYWAIFLLNFGTSVAYCLLSWTFSGWRPGKRASLRQVSDILGFGAHFTLGTVATYFGRNLDKVLIGRFWGTTALGYYERAYKVVLMPILFVHNPLMRVALPMLSQTRGDPGRYRRIFMLSFQLSLLLTVPGIVLLASAAAQVVDLVMGPQWIVGAPVFAWLAVACLGQLATGPLTMLFVSQDRAREAMISSVVTSIYSSVAFVIGLPWGATGVAMAYAFSELIRTPVMLWYASRSGPVSFADTGRAILPFVAATPLCFLAVTHLAWLTDGRASPLVFTLISSVAVYLLAIPCLLLNQAGRQCLGEMVSIGRSVALRTRAAA